MKILIVGDPHGAIENVRKVPSKGIDLILLTGDIGKADLARKRHFENINRKKEGLPELEQTAKHQRDVHMEIHSSTIKVLDYLRRIAPVYSLQGNVGIPSAPQINKEKKKYGLNLPSTRKKLILWKIFTLSKIESKILMV